MRRIPKRTRSGRLDERGLQNLPLAKDQVGYGGWGRWLAKNFDLTARTASNYMRLAREHDNFGKGLSEATPRGIFEMTGGTERRREERQSKQQQAFRRVLRDVARDEFVQERQARDEEIKLHRELAEELIDLGYRATAAAPGAASFESARRLSDQCCHNLKVMLSPFSHADEWLDPYGLWPIETFFLFLALPAGLPFAALARHDCRKRSGRVRLEHR